MSQWREIESRVGGVRQCWGRSQWEGEGANGGREKLGAVGEDELVAGRANDRGKVERQSQIEEASHFKIFFF